MPVPPVRRAAMAARRQRQAPPWQPANPVLSDVSTGNVCGVRLGTAVQIWLPERFQRGSVQEGVVVAVVAPGTPVPVTVANHRPLFGWRTLVPHYVVQCSTSRVLRRASEMDVISL